MPELTARMAAARSGGRSVSLVFARVQADDLSACWSGCRGGIADRRWWPHFSGDHRDIEVAYAIMADASAPPAAILRPAKHPLSTCGFTAEAAGHLHLPTKILIFEAISC
jgi:hypothetical protein